MGDFERPQAGPADEPARDDRISIAIGFKRPLEGPAASVPPRFLEEALRLLEREGFTVVAVGRQSVVVTGTEKLFVEKFRSKLEKRPVPRGWNYSSPFEYIAENPATWDKYPALRDLVDHISVERPHIYIDPIDTCLAQPPRPPRPWAGLGAPFAGVSAQPPAIDG